MTFDELKQSVSEMLCESELQEGTLSELNDIHNLDQLVDFYGTMMGMNHEEVLIELLGMVVDLPEKGTYYVATMSRCCVVDAPSEEQAKKLAISWFTEHLGLPLKFYTAGSTTKILVRPATSEDIDLHGKIN